MCNISFGIPLWEIIVHLDNDHQIDYTVAVAFASSKISAAFHPRFTAELYIFRKSRSNRTTFSLCNEIFAKSGGSQLLCYCDTSFFVRKKAICFNVKI